MARSSKRKGVRSACTAAVLLLCAVVMVPAAAGAQLRGYTPEAGAQYLELGTCPQTLEGGLEPIVWRVLCADGGKAYLLSEYVLCNRRVHYDDVQYGLSGGDFLKTELYGYLNGEFLLHFTAEEQSLLLPGEDGALDSLLSKEDLGNAAYGFTGNAARRGMPTPYALHNGLFQYSNGSSPYWTRTQSASYAYAAVCTKMDGNLGYIRVVVQNEGCRPAIWVDMTKFAIQSGSGTIGDPFEIGAFGGSITE